VFRSGESEASAREIEMLINVGRKWDCGLMSYVNKNRVSFRMSNAA
jgi:hypothetical protein